MGCRGGGLGGKRCVPERSPLLPSSGVCGSPSAAPPSYKRPIVGRVVVEGGRRVRSASRHGKVIPAPTELLEVFLTQSSIVLKCVLLSYGALTQRDGVPSSSSQGNRSHHPTKHQLKGMQYHHQRPKGMEPHHPTKHHPKGMWSHHPVIHRPKGMGSHHHCPGRMESHHLTKHRAKGMGSSA